MEKVKVRLRKTRRVLMFLSHDLELRRDDACIVQTDRGVEYGICVLPPEPCPQGLEKRLSMSVVRRADEKDLSKQERILDEETKARDLCFKKIRKHELPMKLVDAEYTFDKRKIIFYFTAEDRVDFRELVRDLARDLRARIELRHIQVRDEAKVIGGVGSCGRELCCSTWLNEFKPISMKMAKRQNLSLNPSKISGQCGRLMCCLSYENDLYQASKGAREVARKRVEEVAVKRETVELEPMPEVIFNKPRPEFVEERRPVETRAEISREAPAPVPAPATARKDEPSEGGGKGERPKEQTAKVAKGGGKGRSRRRRRGGRGGRKKGGKGGS